MSDHDERELYGVEDVEAILARALTRSEKRDGLSRDELLDAAREVGIDEGALDAAIAEVREDRLVEAEQARITQRRRYGFGTHLFVFVMVNLGLHFLVPRLGIAMALFWGIGLFFHALASLPEAKVDRTRVLRKIEKRRLRKERDRHAADLHRLASDGIAEAIRAATSALGERTRAPRTRDARHGGPRGGFGPPATPRRGHEEAEDAEIVDEPTPRGGRRRHRR